jgi:hypothetical protein
VNSGRQLATTLSLRSRTEALAPRVSWMEEPRNDRSTRKIRQKEFELNYLSLIHCLCAVII